MTPKEKPSASPFALTPPGEDEIARIVLSLRCPRALVQRLDALAKKVRRSRSDVAVQLLTVAVAEAERAAGG